MREKCLFSIIGIMFIIIQPCASLSSGGKSLVVVRNIEENISQQLKIIINGKDKGIIKNGEIKTFNVPNGSHRIVLQQRLNPSVMKGQNWSTVTTDTIALDNERYEIDIRSKGISVVNKYSLSDQITSTQKNSRELARTSAMRNTAIKETFDEINSYIPENSTVAILDFYPNNEEGMFISEELTVLFVNSRKYIIVDRQRLDVIRNEQRFQTSGEVSDETIQSIGNMLGANVVITGNITETNNQKWLRIRALDVKTAQIVAISSEQI